MLHGQKIHVPFFRHIKLVPLWTGKTFLRARQPRVAKGTAERHGDSGAFIKGRKCTAIRPGYKRLG